MTSWCCKSHNVPDWQSSPAGPFDLCPTDLGFEYFYEFIGGDPSQWDPATIEGTKLIEPPHDTKDYFFDKENGGSLPRLKLRVGCCGA
jgi:arylsulfatase A-like enzyme